MIIHGTVPDTMYELLSKTDLTNSTWLSEGRVLGAMDQTNTPAEIDIGSRTNQLFIWAGSWADGNGNGLPEWLQATEATEGEAKPRMPRIRSAASNLQSSQRKMAEGLWRANAVEAGGKHS